MFSASVLLQILKELQALQLPTSEDDVSEIVDKAINSAEFWSRGRKVVQVLRPLFQVLDFIDGDGSTSGYLYEAMKRAEEAIEQHCDANDLVHYATIRNVFKKSRSRVVHPIHAAAAFLNPAYFCKQEAFSRQLQLYRLKVSNLFTDSAIKMLKIIHPRKWWECCGDHYPILQKYAIRILSQTCATPSFFKFNFQPVDVVDEMTMKVVMMDKSRTLKPQNLEQIDLDGTSGLPKYAPEYINEYSEKQDWPDGVDYCDLLVINDPDEWIISAPESNADDILVE